MIDPEALLKGTTPGPWQWGGTAKYGHIDLQSNTSMIPIVMAFHRKGMQGAEPVFWDRSEGGHPGYSGKYVTASERAVTSAPYCEDIIAIDTPDARLVAAAPELARQLIEVTRQRDESMALLRRVVRSTSTNNRLRDKISSFLDRSVRS